MTSWLQHYSNLLLAGLVGGLFADFLSRRRFISQRWWERKAETYASLMQAISRMHEYFSAECDHATHEDELSERRREELYRRKDEALREIDEIMRIGEFVISREAQGALQRMRSRRPGKPGWWPELECDYDATKACLKEFRDAAIFDLRVGPGGAWPSWIRRFSGRLRD